MDLARLSSLIEKTKQKKKDIAAQIGMSPQRFGNYVNGLREPDSETIILLANYFGVSVDYLLGNAEPSEFADKQKKPADPKISGLHSTGYDELTPENREVIDSLIEKLLKSQSDD